MKNTAQNIWLTDFNQPMKNKVRLFVFPYSGAGAVIYHSWAQYLSDNDIDLVGVQLPGREKRFHEKAITDLPTLIDSLVKIMRPLTNIPFAFFGHSLGGLIAFELSRRLEKEKSTPPEHLFVSGFRAPDMPNPNQELHQLDDTTLLKKIVEYGGTPEAILNNTELMALLLPTIRADFKLFETYQYIEEQPLNVPITLFSGKEDAIVKPTYMQNWKRQTYKPLRHLNYPGGHFFINTNRDSVMEKVANQLLR